jgi:ureidoglycolate hydrolase
VWGGHEASHFPWVLATTSMMVHLMHLLDVIVFCVQGGSQGIVITWVTCCWHYPLVCLVEQGNFPISLYEFL